MTENHFTRGANKDYLQKQIQIASVYLTDEQKDELRQKGIVI